MADIRVTARYEGLDGVKAMIERALRAVSPPEVTGSLGRGADVMVEAVQQVTPVRSGALRASITRRQAGELTYEIGPRGIVYAGIQNFGGETESTRPGGWMGPIDDGGPKYIKHARIPATHYMEKGFAAGAGPAAEAFKKDVITNIG